MVLPRPSSRLDLMLVPPMEGAVTVARALFAQSVEAGICLDSGAPGPAANTWIAGGFARIRVDVPLTPTLYANQQGGFRVFCPSCTDNVVPVFAPVLAAFRVSGVARLTCPHCTVSTPIAELTFTPSAAVGQAALVIADAADGQLQDGVLQDLEERFGPVAIVAARVSAR
ncbi:MAG: hypothetical protein ACI855_000899 [Myxococcota bacterium]